MNVKVEKYWRRSLQMALVGAVVSFAADRELVRAAFGIWEDPTPMRLVFFLSVAVLVAGLARNTARLQALMNLRTAPVPADQPAAPSDDHRPVR